MLNRLPPHDIYLGAVSALIKMLDTRTQPFLVHIIFHPENEMKKFINAYIKSDYDIVILRLSVIIIFILFGTHKWSDFEVIVFKSLISPTWLNILYIMFGVHGGSYFLGIIETIIFLALSIGFLRPVVGILGDIIVIVAGLVTLSLLPQLGKVDSFVIKDAPLLGAGSVLLKYDLKSYLGIKN